MPPPEAAGPGYIRSHLSPGSKSSPSSDCAQKHQHYDTSSPTTADLALVSRLWRGFYIHDGNYSPLEPAIYGADLILRPDLYGILENAVGKARLLLGVAVRPLRKLAFPSASPATRRAQPIAPAALPCVTSGCRVTAGHVPPPFSGV